MAPTTARGKAALLAAALVLTATACTAAAGNQAGGSRADTIVIGNHDAGTTYVRNFNIIGPATQKTPGANLVYEPLVRIDYGKGGTIAPWLAESWDFDDAGTTVTFTLRDDVNFSDGTPMTADDVVYSLSLPLRAPEFNLAGVTYAAVDKVDDRHVAVAFDRPAFSELGQFANGQLPVVPEAVWSAQDLKTWTNPDPVGTGPFTLDAFAPQQIKLKARDDYWGGKLETRFVKIIPTNQDAAKAQLLRGDIDWAWISWAGADKEYVAPDPKNHLYQLYATGGAYSLLFNTAKAPFDDAHLRRALAMTIPRGDIVATLNRPGTESGPTGLVDELYADWLKPEYRNKVQEVDAKGAKEELAAGGYTVDGGALVKNGQRFQPVLSFNRDFGWDAYAGIMINSWRDVLGIEVKPAGAPSANLYEQQQLGEFDMTIATTGGAGVFGVYSGFNSAYAKPLGQKAAGNYGRWHDTNADQVLTAMARTGDDEELHTLAGKMQDIVVDQVPFSPIYNSYWFVSINAAKWTGWPTPEKFDHVPFPGIGQDATLTLLGLKAAT